MKSRLGVKSLKSAWSSTSILWRVKWKAAAKALAVQLPKCPWLKILKPPLSGLKSISSFFPSLFFLSPLGLGLLKWSTLGFGSEKNTKKLGNSGLLDHLNSLFRKKNQGSKWVNDKGTIQLYWARSRQGAFLAAWTSCADHDGQGDLESIPSSGCWSLPCSPTWDAWSLPQRTHWHWCSPCYRTDPCLLWKDRKTSRKDLEPKKPVPRKPRHKVTDMNKARPPHELQNVINIY